MYAYLFTLCTYVYFYLVRYIFYFLYIQLCFVTYYFPFTLHYTILHHLDSNMRNPYYTALENNFTVFFQSHIRRVSYLPSPHPQPTHTHSIQRDTIIVYASFINTSHSPPPHTTYTTSYNSTTNQSTLIHSIYTTPHHSTSILTTQTTYVCHLRGQSVTIVESYTILNDFNIIII